MSLIARLSNIYGEPDCLDPNAYLEEISRLVREFSSEEQTRAGDKLLRSHRGRQFPTPHEIIAACEEARKEGVPVGRTFEKQRTPGWDEPDFSAADKLMKTPMGREAALGGWSLGLHDFCRYVNRLPDAHEAARIIREVREFDEAYAACCEGRRGMAGDDLKKLGESMLARRNKYAAMALGEDAA